MKRVILESPFAGDVESNLQYARKCLHHSLSLNEAPIASHLLYPQCLDDAIPEERKKGIEAGLAWYPYAQSSVIYVDRGVSSGMKMAIQRAGIWNTPCKFRRIEQRPDPFYILISGKRGSGKDTLALQLQERLVNSTIFGFANTLKYQYAHSISYPGGLCVTGENGSVSIPFEEIYRRLVDDYAFKQEHRSGLIDLARKEKEKHGEDVWVQRLIKHPKAQSGIIIIPDLRYRYELGSCSFKKMNSLKIRVTCSDSVRTSRGWQYDPKIDTDVSEIDLDQSSAFDELIRNDGTVEDLMNRALTLIERYVL